MDDRLKQLFDYTKFHIGMYTTLSAVIIGVFAHEELSAKYHNFLPYIQISVGMFFIAGAAGGLVASSIPFYDSFKEFSESKLGPWNFKIIPAIICIHIEHTAFWLGCCVGIIGLYDTVNSLSECILQP